MKVKKLYVCKLASAVLTILIQNPVFAQPICCYNCGSGGPARISVNKKLELSDRVQYKSYEALNLKNNIEMKAVTSSPITVEAADFNTICSSGNTWLTFISGKNLNINVGNANIVTPQSWALPEDLMDNFDYGARIDFIDVNSIPVPLRISGANKAAVRYYFDQEDRIMKVYDHYNFTSTKIEELGTSYDLVVDDDDVFDDEDRFISNMPLQLNDQYSTSYELYDYETNAALFKKEMDVHVDAFGSISTPDGTYSCLRLNILYKNYERPNVSVPYTLTTTSRVIGFFTREGVFFYGVASGPTGNVTLTNFNYRIVVSTADLTDLNEVKINNDGKGVALNMDSDEPHASAILDIKNDSLGILIPRIASANRPSSPATGLLVYQTDNTPGIYYYDGTNWKILSSTNSSFALKEEDNNANNQKVPNAFSGISSLKKGSSFVSYPTNKGLTEANTSIFIQAEGDCKGIYIKNKTEHGFEVKEYKKGKSNIKFNYTIYKNEN